MVNKAKAGKNVNDKEQRPVLRSSNQPISKSCLKDKLARARQDLCWRLVHKVKNLGNVSCNQCKKVISFSPKRSNAPMKMKRHMESRHMKAAVFCCRACDKSTTSKEAILGHFANRHAGITMSTKFDDRTNEFHEEIMSQLSACFGTGMTANESIQVLSESTIEKPMESTADASADPAIEEPTEPANVTSTADAHHISASPNKRAIKEQSLLCMEMIRKTASRAIVCRLCSKLVSVKNKKARSFIDHVHSTHLRKQLYGCRICKLRFFGYAGVKSHYYDRHRGTSFHDNYDYFLADDRNEVILLLRKCFDTDAPMQVQSPRATLNGYFSKVDEKPQPKPAVKSVSEVKEIGEGISPSVYKCKVCMASFKFETVLSKHMDFFHRGV